MAFFALGSHRKRSSSEAGQRQGCKSSSRDKDSHKPKSIGGTYVSMLTRSDSTRITESSLSSSSTTIDSSESSWTPSSSKFHHKHSCLLAQSTERPLHLKQDGARPDTQLDETEELSLILQRSRNLPGTWYYSSNHVLVNKERSKRAIPPLIRRTQLDELARQHAETMAAEDSLRHSDPRTLMTKVARPCRRLGENVSYGDSIREMHRIMMETGGSDKNNMLDRRFVTMGMGTARGFDGGLYMCQIFKA